MDQKQTQDIAAQVIKDAQHKAMCTIVLCKLTEQLQSSLTLMQAALDGVRNDRANAVEYLDGANEAGERIAQSVNALMTLAVMATGADSDRVKAASDKVRAEVRDIKARIQRDLKGGDGKTMMH